MTSADERLSERNFPPVSWDDLREHLVTRLMMDPEWIVEGQDQLAWWPTPLPMTIRVVGGGTFPHSSENWLRVAATTVVALADEPLGRQLASEHSSDYPVGALIYVDGALQLTTIYSFNPRNRTLLDWFHQALLIQAAVALDLAGQWVSLEGVHVPTPPHPVMGERSDVDELVGIYTKDELDFSINHATVDRFEAIRPWLKNEFLRSGYQPGFSDDEVDFYNFGFGDDEASGALQEGAFDFALGFMPGTSLDDRFGPSLRIFARVLAPGVCFDAEGVTAANEALCDLAGTSVFGFISGPERSDAGSSLWAMVPHLTLTEWANLGQVDFQNSVLNAVWHITAAAQVLRREVLGIHWPAQNSGDTKL